MITLLQDNAHLLAYSTDASVYCERPFAVAYPQNVEDIKELISLAKQHNTNIIARAGGTSIAGQVVGNGIVADISRHLNHIIEINPKERYAVVEPGVVRDELNIACKQYGLFFSPETSTSNRCCIGGMFGNNSCGTHSLVYGSTRPHIIEAEGILADGTCEHFKDYTILQLEQRFGENFWLHTDNNSAIIQQIYCQLINWALDQPTRLLIEQSYPDRTLARRSCGYAIDETIERLHDNSVPFLQRTINLCRLLAGSEGTLAFIYKIKVSLDPLPPAQIMTLCAHCKSLEAAFEANLIALSHKPTAVELMDGEILLLSKNNSNVERFFVEGNPEALLIAELRSDTLDDLNQQANRMEKDLLESGHITLCTRVYGDDVSKVWNLRKAGLGILSGMKGDAKPTGVIEDTAVTPQRLPAYMADFRDMLKRLNTSCVFYGHISTGELHLRPILNLKTEQGKQLFRQIAYETTLLVRKHRGTISGEHGDGRLRGEFIPLQYGDEAYQLMRQVKYCWDKDNIFNPHKIVDTPRMDSNLRVETPHDNTPTITTQFNWKATFDECKTEGATGAENQNHALLCSVEQCNGAGDCRKSNIIGGTMCPAYKVSRDELMSTRARANIIREYLYDKNNIEEVKAILNSCLACKACKKECPSNVDMTSIRAEILQNIYDEQSTPFHTWLVAHNADLQHIGSFVPHIYNFFATNKLTSAVLKHIAGFAQERNIPKIQKFKQQSSYLVDTPKGTIYFFADEFTTCQDAEIGLTFIKLLNRLGYNVLLPKHVESGRSAISKGCLRQAKRFAEKNVELLKDIVSAQMPLVGIEPSCILSFRDEYPDLVKPAMRQDAKELGKNSLLFDEFLVREIESGNITSNDFSDLPAEIWLHGHCHQKALVGTEKTAQILNLPVSTTVHTIASGCCGMAGSFGYEKEHYKTSIAIGEMILFPAVREAVKNNTIERPVFIAAPGTSCRAQIYDGTGIKAYHPIEILYKLIRSEK
ncbi:MAG: FAD-binding protein [Paludibacteraceae bacterium]|nr:FAD-binding protein [Paludibacteraceae bacterium]